MLLNTTIQALVDDMRDKITIANGYSTKPTINKGSGTVNIPVFPFIEVMPDDPRIEEFVGGNRMVMVVPVTIQSFSKQKQKDSNDHEHNNIIEDILHYILNDCLHKNDLEIEPNIESLYGELERGDAFFSSMIKVSLKIEYTINQINQ